MEACWGRLGGQDEAKLGAMLGLEEDVIEEVEEEACQEAVEENEKRVLKRKSPKCHACQQKQALRRGS